MTDRDESTRDPALERAWAAQSRETPPPALDRAILAAAHRAAGAGPRDATSASAHARRPPSWWMPLAAAAVVGVVAIGVVQVLPDTQLLTPHETPAPFPQETASAPAPALAAKRDPAQADAVAETQPPQREAPPASLAPSPAQSPTVPASPASEGKVAQAPIPFPAAEAERTAEAVAPPPRPATAEMRAAPAPAAPTAPMPAPFGTNQTRVERQASTPAAVAPRDSANGAPSEAGGLAASPSRARDLSAEGEGARRQPPPMPQATPSALAKSAANDARAKARDPDAWLLRIRKLRDDGDVDGAARELREFRSLVPDADARIPADLRAWAATIR